jgi:uncharacterized LabA/DUF88 family protein
MDQDRKFAVLIDADNISDKYIKIVLDEVAAYGIATYKRIYGDWTTPRLGSWKTVLLDNSIIPIQQYSYTFRKNATDSAMTIDAMDILYSGNVSGFCIVSSDSDFTRLVARLRESGMMVIGMGESKTPKSFIAACNQFKYLDILYANSHKISKPIQRSKKMPFGRIKENIEETAVRTHEPKDLGKHSGKRAASKQTVMLSSQASSGEEQDRPQEMDMPVNVDAQPELQKSLDIDLQQADRDISQNTNQPTEEYIRSDADYTGLEADAAINQATEPDVPQDTQIDTQQDRSQQEIQDLSLDQDMIQPPNPVGTPDTMTEPEACPIPELPNEHGEDLERVELEPQTDLQTIIEAITSIVEDYSDEDGWMFSGDLGNHLAKRYPDFDVRNFGYNKLTMFIESLNKFEVKRIVTSHSNVKLVYIRLRTGENIKKKPQNRSKKKIYVKSQKTQKMHHQESHS